MAVVKSCCWFFSVRKGALSIGIFSFVLSLISVCIIGITLVSAYTGSIESKYIVLDTGENPSINKTIHGDFLVSLLWALFSISNTYAVFSILLIIGIFKNEKRLMLPWIACQLCGLVLGFILLAYKLHYVTFGITYESLLLSLLSFIFQVYFLLIVFSHYQNLEEEGRLRDSQDTDIPYKAMPPPYKEPPPKYSA